ncbi:MAG: hypothetical protein BroJett011_19780 [Chloroflexota bacterium]|nr:MAG: hypothetical protein BroJett011_19780 [Chloroflexota bacterium]
MSRIILKIVWNALPLVALGIIILWLSGIFPPSPPPTPQPTVTAGPPILEAIKHVNKQIFIEHYNAVDITYTEVPQSWISIFGLKQEFVVLIRGRVPAGFDLKDLNDEDIWISADGKRVQLTLPSPIIFEDNVAIDFENSHILSQSDTCPNFICEDDLTAYQSQILPTGRDVLIEFARGNGILDQVAKDGKQYYEQFLKSLGFKEVQVVVSGYGL